MEFSTIERSFQKFEAQVEQKNLFAPAPPFSENELQNSAKRLKSAQNSFWSFSKIYFPPEMYSSGYSKTPKFHREIVKWAQEPGVHLIFGARKHGKTAKSKVVMSWLLLTGRCVLAGTYCETLLKSSNMLSDIADLIALNPRIMHDFKPEFLENNADQFTFRLPHSPKPRTCAAFSEGRSLRGYTRGFERPSFLLADDVETRESSMSSGSVELRAKKLQEAFTSLESTGTILIMANDFDEKSALHQIRVEFEQGILPPHWKVHVREAWSGNKPLWKERFPAKTEYELRNMLAPADEAEWQAEYQQSPQPPSGDFFLREHYREWSAIPADAKGVMYTDPNLSFKSKGDSTAIVGVVYSPIEDKFYVLPDVVCRSFADSNKLLDSCLDIYTSNRSKIAQLGFDGNVSQESSWRQHVRNWQFKRKAPFPRISFCRYQTDVLAKNCQGAYSEGRVLFPPEFGFLDDGKRALSQLWGFGGKNKNKADDFPDALICCFELLHEAKIARAKGRKGVFRSITVHDFL